MSYALLGLGRGLGDATTAPIVAAVAPVWPWDSIGCPVTGQALRSIDLADGTKAFFCLQPGATDADVPAQPGPSQLLAADKYGRAGFWTLTNTILVAVGLSIALSIGASVAGSLVVTKAKDRRDAKKADEAAA